MVREVQMGWDCETPMPEELGRSDWDIDEFDPDECVSEKRPSQTSRKREQQRNARTQKLPPETSAGT